MPAPPRAGSVTGGLRAHLATMQRGTAAVKCGGSGVPPRQVPRFRVVIAGGPDEQFVAALDSRPAATYPHSRIGARVHPALRAARTRDRVAPCDRPAAQAP